MTDKKHVFEVKAIHTTLHFPAESGGFPTMERLRESDDLDDAMGWLVAQVRGNNRVSDDRCLHYAAAHLEKHFGFVGRERLGVRARLDRLTDLLRGFAFSDTDTECVRARGVIAAMWGIREGYDKVVRDADDYFTEVKPLFGPSPIDTVMDALRAASLKGTP